MKDLTILLLLLIFGCAKSNENTLTPISHAPVKVYSWKEYEDKTAENPTLKIIIVDTICPFETQRAETDIKKDKLILYSYACISETLDELNLVLKPYNITARVGNKSCIRPPEGFHYFCYEEVMYAEIERRHGQKWIDSMESVAIKNYVIKNPSQPYFEGGKDLREKYIKK